MTKIIKLCPGLLLSVAIAAVATFIESLMPIHLIGGAVIAMFLGMVLNHFIGGNKLISSGVKFTSKKLLKFAIILLGLSLNITTTLTVGRMSLTAFTSVFPMKELLDFNDVFAMYVIDHLMKLSGIYLEE